MNIRLHHIAIGIGMISLMTFLFFKTTVIDSDAHNRFSSDLRHLKEIDATLDKNILESRYGLLSSYDLLNTETSEINQLRATVKNIPAFIDRDGQEKIQNLLAEHSDLQAEKESLIERFKSRNAIINNSLRYFPVTTSDLIKNMAVTGSRQNESESLNFLLRDILIYYLLTDTHLEPEITNQIAVLKEFQEKLPVSDNKTALNISISHARTILKLKPEVDKLVKETLSVQTAEQIEKVIELYDSYYNQSLSRANTYRLFLYIFSVLLIAYIGFIIFKLKKATSALNAVNESLEERVRERTEALLWSNSELQKSEANNNALLHALPDAMWRTDINGAFIDMIPAKGEKTIMPASEWLGKTIFEVLPEDVAQQTIRLAEQSLDTGETQVFEYQLTKNDSVHHYESRIVVCGESEILTVVRDITESKRIEEALRENEAKFRDLFDNAPIAYHELDTEGRFMRINHTEELMLGYTSDELKGRHPWEIIVEKVSREATKAKLGGKIKLEPVERTFIRKDGTHVSVLNEDRMIYDSDGNVTGIRSTLQDITKRKRMEAESHVISEIIQGVSMTSNLKELLKHIHRSISKLIYAENCFVALYNESTEILDLQLFVDKFDSEPPSLKLGQGLTAYVFRNQRPMLLTSENIRQLIKDREIEMVGTSPAVWLGVPLRTPNGIMGVLVIQHYEDENAYNQYDLELLTSVGDQIALAIERKRSEEALKASELRFLNAFDYAPIGIGLASKDGDWMQVNRSLCEIVGYTKEELLRTNFQTITHPDDLAASLEFKEQLLSGKIKSCQMEKRYIHKLGHQVLALTSLSLARDAQNNPLYFISQIQDITEKKSLEEQLQQGQKLESIGHLAAGIAHEINTPTQYVGDNTRFLKEGFQDFSMVLEKNRQLLEACQTNTVTPELIAEMEEAIEQADIEYLTEEVPKAIEQALNGIDRISKIVQSMKDFAHPGSVDKKASDLNKAIESTITVASNEWKYIAEMETDYDQNLPSVPCMVGEFNQVILNIIINASHAISDVIGDGNGKGKISISTKLNGNWAEIRISDTGTGIPEEVCKKIFDPFFTTKEVGKGTGQGLAISHSVIVEKHKGILRVESEVGKGTTFIISLPVKEISETD